MIAITAFAGTGKTSTLVEYARIRPEWRFLYIAYNKAMQTEAATRFPRNVDCRTLHSLAYEKIGRSFPTGKIGNNRIWDLSKVLNISEDAQLQVKSASNLLSFWLNSNQDNLDIPMLSGYLSTLPKAEQQLFSSSVVEHNCLTLAKRLWELMLDKTNLVVKMPHDGYLKLFQLSQPIFNIDCVMLDEAQDSNDVTLEIINIAECPHKIVVGDIHQAIYQFRGSKNALADFQKLANQTFYLTHSFRFNQTIAAYASLILQYFKAERHAVIGKGFTGEIKLLKSSAKKISTGTTLLARRNATLFKFAIEALDEGKKVHFAGGIAKYDLDLLTGIANLDIGVAVVHPFVKSFKNLNTLETYAENVMENDILMFIKLVKQNTAKKILATIKELLTFDEWVLANPLKNIPLCDHLFTTAHRSKGLEFTKVIIADDFNEFYQLIEDNSRSDYLTATLSSQSRINYEQEVNLYYVAITRAKHELLLLHSPINVYLPELFEECGLISSKE